MKSEKITLLKWDTGFFGFPIAQISQGRLNQKIMERANMFCRENQIRLLQFKCDAHHRPSILIAEENDFHFADVRMIYRQKLTEMSSSRLTLPEDFNIRLARDSDCVQLREIVRNLYTLSRYYFDTNFPREKVQKFYQDWIEKAVHGCLDDLAWVICEDEKIIGFCSVSLGKERRARIGLFGVDPSLVGQGLGSLLLQDVLVMLADRSVEQVSVVTQGRNYFAQRLYQKMGFLIDRIEIYYHRWFNERDLCGLKPGKS